MKKVDAGNGIVLILFTAFMFAGSDATVKHLGASIPVLILLWVRYMIQTGTMAGWMCLQGGVLKVRSSAPGLQVLRGLLLLLNSGTAFYGLQFVPLAEFTALVLLAPVMTTVIGAVVLKEPVSSARWAMVVLGVAGMLTVIRPAGVSALGWEALLPIGSALCYAALQVLTRRIATQDDLVLTNLISATIVTTVLGAALWYSPLEVAPTLRAASAAQWSFLLVLGCLATAGQVSMAAAVRVAPLSLLMPFAYVQIAFAAFIGWLVFGHMPDAWSVLGIGFICLGGVGTVWLNARP